MTLSAMQSFKPREYGSFEDARDTLGEVRGFVVWAVKRFLIGRTSNMKFTVGGMIAERYWQEPHPNELGAGNWEESIELPHLVFANDDTLHEDILDFLRSEKGEVDYLDDGESTRYTWEVK